jgi:hypothetical protein
MAADLHLRSLKIGDDYVPPMPDLRPWFMTSSARLQDLLDLDSPPTLHPALIVAHCTTTIYPSMIILRGAPSMVKTFGDVYFPTSATEVSALEESAVGLFKVKDVDMVIDRGEGREEIEGRAIVFLGGQRQLQLMIAETRRDRALWEVKEKEFMDKMRTWADGVEEGDWEEVEVVWERIDRKVEMRRTWG